MKMRLRFLAVISCLVFGARAEFECSPRKSSEGPLPPVLPKSFHMVYEKNDKLNGATKFYDVWFDWINQRARVDEVADGKGRVLLFDFATGVGFVYDVPRPGTDETTDERSFLCEYFPINAESPDLYFYNPKEKPLRMVDIYQALLFGGPFRYAYAGTANKSTRFIDTNVFEGCVKDYQTDKWLEVTYYWTVEGPDTPDEFVKPVMCERKGEDLHELLSIIRFDRDPEFSSDTFKVPRHMDCIGFPVVSDAKEIPSMSDDFAWREETLTYSKDDEGGIQGDIEESYKEIWVADQYKLARLDWTPKASEVKNTFLESFAGKPLSVVADMNYGAVFITTNNNGRCVVQPLTEDFPLSKKISNKFVLKKAAELLGLDGPRVMKGEYLERGNPVFVYSTEYKINANDAFTTLHETTLRFDLQQAVDSYGAFEFVPVSQLTRRIASDPENVVEAKISFNQTSYFRYRSEHHPLHIFAAPGCVVHHKRRHFELRFASSTWDVISKRKNIFLDSLRREIYLRGEFDTVMRVHDVDVIEDSDVIARMTLLEPLDEITSKNAVTVDEAAKNIAAIVNEGHMAVPLEFEDGDQLLALENTFKEVIAEKEAALLSRPVREIVEKSAAEAGSGYSLGAFIGICFGAFFLGVGCGFLIIYIKVRSPQSSTPDEVPLGDIEQNQTAGDPNRPGPSGWRQNQAQTIAE